jgi:hypothetical protein
MEGSSAIMDSVSQLEECLTFRNVVVEAEDLERRTD